MKIPNIAPPRLRRMIRVADLEGGGYGSLEGMKVYIVVILVASDMLLLFGKRAGGEVGGGVVERRWGRMLSGKHRRASWVSSVREFIFFPLPSFLSSSGGGELTKNKNTFGNFDISAFRFSIAAFSQVRIISRRFSFVGSTERGRNNKTKERRTSNMTYTIYA